jgi:hypothetical protein
MPHIKGYANVRLIDLFDKELLVPEKVMYFCWLAGILERI